MGNIYGTPGMLNMPNMMPNMKITPMNPFMNPAMNAFPNMSPYGNMMPFQMMNNDMNMMNQMNNNGQYQKNKKKNTQNKGNNLEYIEKHPGLDVKRIPITVRNRDGSKDIIRDGQNVKAKFIATPIDVKKENAKLKKANKNKKGEEEENEKENWGYQQIVIFE